MVFGFGSGRKKKKGKGDADDIAIRDILLTRDLTRFQVVSAKLEGGEKPKTVTLRSNRLITTWMRDNKRHIIVVRGKSMAGTLRMFQSVLKVLSSLGGLTQPGAAEDLEAEWAKFLEGHIPEGVDPDWIAVYDTGMPIMNTRQDTSIDALEALVIEGPVTQKHMASFGKDFFNKSVSMRREVSAAHESQPVFNVENMGKAIKVTILNRDMGRGGQLSYRIPMPRLYDAYALGTDIVELHNRIAEFEMLKKKLLVDQDMNYLKRRGMVPVSRELLETLLGSYKHKSESLQAEFTPAAPEFTLPE